jgi:hypothetical protein
VDVEALLREYADVEILGMPFDVDGICFDLKVPGRRPRVFVNNQARSERRVRFTLAHELGHILLPWHSGLIVDKLDGPNDPWHSDYWRLEREANRFASELLVPGEWAGRIFAAHSAPTEAVTRIYRRANVSYHMATLKVLRILPPGYTYARIRGGVVISSGASDDTLAPAPTPGETPIDLKNYYGDAQVWSDQISDIFYYWWFTGAKDTVLPTIGEQWKAALTMIVNDLDCDQTGGLKFKNSINGMIALVNGRVKSDRTVSTIVAACIAHLNKNAAKNALLAEAMQHELFEEFLTLKIRALID